jgi:GTP-binding protein EngB required for normal cell division
MKSFKRFSAEKNELIARLDTIRDVLLELGELGLDVTMDIDKVANAVKDVKNDMLRIALLGAFSDGKTSVIASWLGCVTADMKIDTDESSDRLAIYHPEGLPDRCEIVDTPGLFGNKEKSDEQGRTIQFGDVTKRHLSQAHLIFYVVDATNPLKESHKDIVYWVLRDLGKLSTTIFVINKMDEVADLSDSEDFDSLAKIKKENLLEKLDRFLSLTPAERAAIKIVCIAANPNNRGLDVWFANDKRSLYEERSRINTLKSATTDILASTAREVLIQKTGLDVLDDIVQSKLATADLELKHLQIMAGEAGKDIGVIEDDIKSARRRISNTKLSLLQELENLEKPLLAKVRTLDRASVIPFLQDEIGYTGDDVGFRLRLKIELLCECAFEQSTAVLDDITVRIDRQLESSASFVDALAGSFVSYAKDGLGMFSKMPSGTVRDGVLIGRDMLKSVTGASVKFKPWGALKLAGNAQAIAGSLGALMEIAGEVVEIIQQVRAQNELEALKGDLIALITAHFKAIYNILADDAKVLETFAPQIGRFEAVLEQQRTALVTLEGKRQSLARLEGAFQAAIAPPK